jgi:hypothetical protein
MTDWSLDTITWDEFDSARVNPQLLAFARGAWELQSKFRTWGQEERRHGLAIKKWVELADPKFDFERSLAVFRVAYQQVPEEGDDSVRGSKARELVARCIVECGTSSFYSALKDAAEEPVFKELCHFIALDEVRHFNLFRKSLEGRYGPAEKLSVVSRVKVVVGRMLETSDEELSFAYRAGNFPDEPIDPERTREYSKDYMSRIAQLYDPAHFRLGLGLAMKAAGINAGQRVRTLVAHIAHGFLRFRYPAANTDL